MDRKVLLALISSVTLIVVAVIGYYGGRQSIDCDQCSKKCICLTSIEKMESSTTWDKHNDSNSSMQYPTNVRGKVNNAIKFSYNISNGGYAGIEKRIKSGSLANIKGLKIYYKGSGASNTLEINLKRTNGPVFGYPCNKATNTSDEWTTLEIPINQFRLLKCDGGSRCENTSLDLNKVDVVEFYVSNKPTGGDIAGEGYIAIDEVEARTC